MFNYRGLLQYAKEMGASDVHLSAGERPMIRFNGEIKKVDYDKLGNEGLLEIIQQILSEEQCEKLKELEEIDGVYDDAKIGRYRFNVFQSHKGFAMSFRIINQKIRTCKELGLPEVVKDIKNIDKGLVLVTGPAGSGKSTTLATLVDMLNMEHKKHILTIEDPVEFVHEPDQAVVNHRQVGSHTHSFEKALKSALREDPDVILIGELRDIETISLALTAAETGHLVLGTLHTQSAARTMNRIVDAFPPTKHDQIRMMLAESIQMVISQVLLPKKDRTGQIVAFEIMVGTTAIRSLIRENKIHQIPSSIETGQHYGMTNLDNSIQALIDSGIVDMEDARHYISHTENLHA